MVILPAVPGPAAVAGQPDPTAPQADPAAGTHLDVGVRRRLPARQLPRDGHGADGDLTDDRHRRQVDG